MNSRLDAFADKIYALMRPKLKEIMAAPDNGVIPTNDAFMVQLAPLSGGLKVAIGIHPKTDGWTLESYLILNISPDPHSKHAAAIAQVAFGLARILGYPEVCVSVWSENGDGIRFFSEEGDEADDVHYQTFKHLPDSEWATS